MNCREDRPPFEAVFFLLNWLRNFDMVGKAYANKKTSEERNKNDYYPTPKVLVVELEKLNLIKKTDNVLEPCCGEAKQISGYFNSLGYNFEEKDLIYGNDFLKDDYFTKHYDFVVTNPPFSLWDKFVEKSKRIADNVIMIGRTNYFGAYNRYRNGLWNHLKTVYIFDRQIAYDRFDEDEMKFKCGCLVTAWFHWDMNYGGKPSIEIMDIQKYLE